MNWLLLCRMLGLLAMLVGGSMVFSLPWAFPECGQTAEFESRGFWGLVSAISLSLAVGATLSYIGRKEHSSILRKEALAIVGLGWMLAGVLGALPFLFAGTMRDTQTPMTVADAVFESVSGFTTTGASVLTELEDPSQIARCILFWRCFTHWLGGMGIIVLFVAILGQLGAAGKALMRREVPGPITESVRPRIREQAIVMWTIYMVISGILAVALWLEGMTVYDALCHTFATMATGGFSTLNRSVAGFDSPLIEYTIIVFMIAAGTNFSLFYLVTLHRRNPLDRNGWWGRFGPLFRDVEFRAYLTILAVSTAILTFDLLWLDHYESFLEAFRYASFQAVSIMTTTGYGTADFDRWSEFAKGLLLLLMFVGGCAGSTGGGLKVIRFVLFAKIMRLEIEQAFRPNVVRPLRIAGVTLDNSLRHDVLVYFCLVLTVFVGSWMLLAAIETDDQWYDASLTKAESLDEHRPHRAEKLLDCASAVAATLNNIGPGLGVVGPTENYAAFSGAGKILLTVCMLLGRLELFAILVLFVPSFWKAH